MDFAPMIKNDENSQMYADMKGKKNIIITMKNVGDILDLDTRYPFVEEKDAEGYFI